MEQVNLRAKYDAQYASARANLGAVVLLSLVNVGLMVLDAGVSFLFSAVLPCGSGRSRCATTCPKSIRAV